MSEAQGNQVWNAGLVVTVNESRVGIRGALENRNGGESGSSVEKHTG